MESVKLVTTVWLHLLKKILKICWRLHYWCIIIVILTYEVYTEKSFCKLWFAKILENFNSILFITLYSVKFFHAPGKISIYRYVFFLIQTYIMCTIFLLYSDFSLRLQYKFTVCFWIEPIMYSVERILIGQNHLDHFWPCKEGTMWTIVVILLVVSVCYGFNIQ